MQFTFSLQIISKITLSKSCWFAISFAYLADLSLGLILPCFSKQSSFSIQKKLFQTSSLEKCLACKLSVSQIVACFKFTLDFYFTMCSVCSGVDQLIFLYPKILLEWGLKKYTRKKKYYSSPKIRFQKHLSIIHTDTNLQKRKKSVMNLHFRLVKCYRVTQIKVC